MKRIIALFLLCFMIVSCFALTSCNTEEEVQTSETTESIETVEETVDIVVASEGQAIYKLIRFIDAFQEEVDLIIKFKNQLNSDYGFTFQIGADWTMPSSAPPADACEIIIGLTCREETAQVIEKYKLAYGDYAVKICENNKIVMVAPNYKDLENVLIILLVISR